jgi:hypothetical protein
MVLSPSTAGEEAIAAEEADLAKMVAPAFLKISKGVIGVKEEEVKYLTSNMTRYLPCLTTSWMTFPYVTHSNYVAPPMPLMKS